MLTTTQAAERLGIRQVSVRALIARGLLKAEKIGRDYLITEDELERYERERRPAHRPKQVKEQVHEHPNT